VRGFGGVVRLTAAGSASNGAIGSAGDWEEDGKSGDTEFIDSWVILVDSVSFEFIDELF
jgi:hypothetical protein